MIYLISEDYYFTKGIRETLALEHILSCHTTTEQLQRIVAEICSDDVILLCTQSIHNTQALARLAKNTKASVMFFVDINQEKLALGVYSLCMMSKKSQPYTLVDMLKLLTMGKPRTRPPLTIQEGIIMDYFIEPRTQSNVSKKLKISTKTISTHKINALHKMGLANINAKSLWIYQNIFQA